MNASPPTRDWELERLLLGELPPAKTRALHEKLQQDPALKARLEQLQSQAQALLNTLPPEQFAREVARRAESLERSDAAREPRPARATHWRMLAGISTTVTAALAGVMLLNGLPSSAPSSSAPSEVPMITGGTLDPMAADVTRSKGLEPQLRVYRLEGDRITRLLNAAPVPPHARLQLSYLTPGQPYGVLLSIDGAGAVTLHQPTSLNGEARLDPSGEHRLPFSYELDDAPAFERFFLVSAQKPLTVQTVVAAAEKLAVDPSQAKVSPLPLPSDFHQTSLLLEKVSP